MAVVDEMWYKEIEDPDTFYTKVTALKLLDHLTEFCKGLNTVDAVDIPQIFGSLPNGYIRSVPLPRIQVPGQRTDDNSAYSIVRAT